MLKKNSYMDIGHNAISFSGDSYFGSMKETITPSFVPQNIMVIGGGVAGMEAARVAARRGHKVELYEQKGYLGGNLVAGGMPDFKKECHALIHWYGSELHELNVPIHLHSWIDEEAIRQNDADIILIATGSTPIKQNIPGFRSIFSAESVLTGAKDPGHVVIVAGGGLVGCETALWLKNQGKQVTLIEKQNEILPINKTLSYSSTETLKNLLPQKGITIKTNTIISHAVDSRIVLQTEGQQTELVADSIVTAIGYQANNSLYETLRAEREHVYLLGDAKQVNNVMHAVRDAFDLVSQI
ncbi:NAD(P)/FAD-dependent oxidoreductase [Tolumonas lignilytica]|uniref:NAD(P)/FAD-dependent oxidoreductase n=1 Tax=Tolumonas lignilytica TaxID=1283284 RepID=UPI0004642316|nr:NAD(P)/FAD-dependent oxidoreductase [Tolumonas lignilytica]